MALKPSEDHLALTATKTVRDFRQGWAKPEPDPVCAIRATAQPSTCDKTSDLIRLMQQTSGERQINGIQAHGYDADLKVRNAAPMSLL